jgi:hypothetical protein
MSKLSLNELAVVVGGAIIIVEDGKEQYPADIGSLLRRKPGKRKRRRR